MVSAAMEAAGKLAAKGISSDVINVHTIKPIDAETVLASVRKTGGAVTCENHNIIGGLRSAIAEVVSEGCPVPIKSVGVPDRFGEVTTLDYLLKKFHMTSDDIVAQAMSCIAMKETVARFA
jgi:transketolase